MNKKIWVIIIIVLIVILAGSYFTWAKYYSNLSLSQKETENTIQPEAEVLFQNFPSMEEEVSEATPASSPNPTPAPVVTPAKTYTVNIANFAFSPNSLTINRGDTIIWVNKDSAPHQIVGDDFRSSLLNNGQSYNFKFNISGTYNYICGPHPYMKGVVIVK